MIASSSSTGFGRVSTRTFGNLFRLRTKLKPTLLGLLLFLGDALYRLSLVLILNGTGGLSVYPLDKRLYYEMNYLHVLGCSRDYRPQKAPEA